MNLTFGTNEKFENSSGYIALQLRISGEKRPCSIANKLIMTFHYLLLVLSARLKTNFVVLSHIYVHYHASATFFTKFMVKAVKMDVSFLFSLNVSAYFELLLDFEKSVSAWEYVGCLHPLV